jgi:hypothetical protein
MAAVDHQLHQSGRAQHVGDQRGHGADQDDGLERADQAVAEIRQHQQRDQRVPSSYVSFSHRRRQPLAQLQRLIRAISRRNCTGAPPLANPL